MNLSLVLLGVVVIASLAGCVENNTPFASVLPTTKESLVINLPDNETFTLTASPVRWTLEGISQNGYAYNESIPGPFLKVKQGSHAKINFVNQLPEPTTVHWHGIRVANKDDGVPGSTQKEVASGKTYQYDLIFPDAGLYWYHPHVREDRQQDLGMYGLIWVEPQNPLPVMKEFTWALDDIQLSKNKIQVSGDKTLFALMGRYGNQLLVNGQSDARVQTQTGEWVRFLLVNVSNARPMRFAIDEQTLYVRAMDGGFLPEPVETDAVILAPSERAIVEVQFSQPGVYEVLNQTPIGKAVFGTIEVGSSSIALSDIPEWVPDSADLPPIEKLEMLKGIEPDWEYDIALDWPSMESMMGGGHTMHGGTSSDGVEWEDSMFMMNAGTSSEDVTWILRDPVTGNENMDIMQTASMDSWKVIRLKNLKDSMHPMQHPIHLHGQRFVVLTIDGKPVENASWKDTVLIPSGSTIDIAVEFSNPGEWMLHCHTAEHLESGMMTNIHVE
ncbi:MAG: multicopper oxidase family protein [Candidatus Diapherotrites archaeon]|nr:multicopper oxidase family protein [Candidatus Diapherotrites archaeon]